MNDKYWCPECKEVKEEIVVKTYGSRTIKLWNGKEYKTKQIFPSDELSIECQDCGMELVLARDVKGEGGK